MAFYCRALVHSCRYSMAFPPINWQTMVSGNVVLGIPCGAIIYSAG